MIKSREQRLVEVIKEFLINKLCSCGGWTCPRCRLTIAEAKDLINV